MDDFFLSAVLDFLTVMGGGESVDRGPSLKESWSISLASKSESLYIWPLALITESFRRLVTGVFGVVATVDCLIVSKTQASESSLPGDIVTLCEVS